MGQAKRMYEQTYDGLVDYHYKYLDEIASVKVCDNCQQFTEVHKYNNKWLCASCLCEQAGNEVEED